MRPLIGLLCCCFFSVLPIHAQQARLFLQQIPDAPLAIGDTLQVEIYADAEGLDLTSASAYLSFDEAIFTVLPASLAADGAIEPFVSGPFLPGQIYENSTAGDEYGDNGLAGFQLNYVAVSGAGENRSTGRDESVLARCNLMVVGYPEGGSSVVRLDRAGQRQPLYTTLQAPGVAHRFAIEAELQVEIEGEGLLALADRSMVRGERREIDLSLHYISQKWSREDITWFVWSADPERLEVEVAGQMLSLRAIAGAGEVGISYRVELPDGHMREGNFLVQLEIAASPLLPISLSIAEDAGQQRLDLASFFLDESASAAGHWSVQSTDVVVAEIADEELLLAVAGDWYGSEILSLTWCDEVDHCEATTLELQVESINDPPQIAALGSMAVALGGIRRGPLLHEVISDPDHMLAELQVEIFGDEIAAASIVEGALEIHGLSTGIGQLRLEVTDPYGAQSTAWLEIQVIRLEAGPELEPMKDVVIEVGEGYELAVGVSDADTPLAELTWSVTADDPIAVEVVAGAVPMLELSGLSVGEAVVRLQARDPEGSEATIAFRVQVLAPTVDISTGVEEPAASGNETSTVPVDEEGDVEAELETVVESEPSVSPSEPEVASTEPDEVADEEKSEAANSDASANPGEDPEVEGQQAAAESNNSSFEDQQENPASSPLQLREIPDLHLVAGTMGVFWLDEYVAIGTAENLQWSVAGMAELLVDIDGERRVEVRSPVDFSGREVLLFTAEDGAGNSAVVAVRVWALAEAGRETIAAEGLPAEEGENIAELQDGELALANWPEIALVAGRVDSTLLLDQLVTKGDAQSVVWSLRGGVFIRAHIDGQRRLHLDGTDALQGREIFFLTARLGTAVRQIQLAIGVRTADFALAPLTAVRMEEKEYVLDLNTHVEGDFAAGEIEWMLQAPTGIGAELSNGLLQLSAEGPGLFTLSLSATSPVGQVIEVDLAVEIMAQQVEGESAVESAEDERAIDAEESGAGEVVPTAEEANTVDRASGTGGSNETVAQSSDEESGSIATAEAGQLEQVAVDIHAPVLNLSGHLLSDGAVEFQLRSDEELAGMPVLIVDGQVLSVEPKAAYYAAKYDGAIGSIQVLAAASDLAGNTAETQLALSAGRGQGVLSPDGRLRVQGRLGAVLLYGENNAYRIELQAGSTAELVFSGIEPGLGLYRLQGADWEEIPAQIGSGALVAVVVEGGLYRLAKGAVVLSKAVPTAYPNPFNSEVVLRYEVAAEGPVQVAVYDALGARIRSLINQVQGPGLRTSLWDGRDEAGVKAASGVYLLVVEADGQRRSRKVMLIR